MLPRLVVVDSEDATPLSRHQKTSTGLTNAQLQIILA
jgi:hypothetical protein